MIKRALLIIVCFLLAEVSGYTWGFWAHKRINRMAVFTLPPEMFGFYKENIDYLTQHAVDPDKRRYGSKTEAPRHYIDIDHYGPSPFDSVPRRWQDAVAKYSQDTLESYGIVPWHVYRMQFWLEDAFKQKDKNKILRLSAELGHYIADAHVPLHTTENYNGQLTGQKGIHGFWESRLPELFAEDYDYFVGKATYLDKPLGKMWSIVYDSHMALDSVLDYEKNLTASFSPDKKYGFENGRQVYSREFSSAYHNQLDGMVERRMKTAIINVGSFWMTAWVNAGQPDLSKLEEHAPSEEELKEDQEIEKQYEAGKIKGREHDD